MQEQLLKQTVAGYVQKALQAGRISQQGLLGTLEQGDGFLCAACDKVYPIYDGIPVLLVDKAIPRADWDAGERGERP